MATDKKSGTNRAPNSSAGRMGQEWEAQPAVAAFSNDDEDHESAPPRQIECPPCTSRLSTLPVCEIRQGQQREAINRRDGLPLSSLMTGAVRQNRASQLRQWIYRPSSCIEDAETTSGSTVSENSESSVVGRLSKSSMITSLLKLSDSVARGMNESILESIEVNPTEIAHASTDSISPQELRQAAAKPCKLNLNLSRLKIQLQETDRQRLLLKDRIAGLAKVLESPDTLEGTASMPVDIDGDDANQVHPAAARDDAETKTYTLHVPSENPKVIQLQDPNTSPEAEGPPSAQPKPFRQKVRPPVLASTSTLYPSDGSTDVDVGSDIQESKPDSLHESSESSAHSERQFDVNKVQRRFASQLNKRASADFATLRRKTRRQHFTPPVLPVHKLDPPIAVESASVNQAPPALSVSSHRRTDDARHQSAVGVQACTEVESKSTQLNDERVQSLLTRLREAAEECAELRLNREATRRELDAAKFDLRMLSADAQDKKSELTQMRLEVDTREDRIRQLSAVQTRAEKEAGNLRNKLVELRHQLDSAENGRQAEQARNERYRAQLTKLGSQMDSRMSELTSVTNALIEKRRSEEELLARVQQLQRDLTKSDENVRRLTDLLAAEQKRTRETPLAERERLHQQQPPSRSQQHGSLASQSHLSPSDGRAPVLETPAAEKSEVAIRLEQRMSDLDARINRLVAEAKDRGWRQHQKLAEQQQQSGIATSTPQSPDNGKESIVHFSEASLESLQQRTAQLETSNQQLVQDVQSLRGLCSDLLHSRQELKRRLSISQFDGIPDRKPQSQSALSAYLFETETLRAMIQRQVCDMQSVQSVPQGRDGRHQLLLSDELQIQQDIVNRCWQTVENSFQAFDSSAYRDFYLSRVSEQQQRLTSRYSEGVLSTSTRPMSHDGTASRDRPSQLRGTLCGCRHSENCPLESERRGYN